MESWKLARVLGVLKDPVQPQGSAFGNPWLVHDKELPMALQWEWGACAYPLRGKRQCPGERPSTRYPNWYRKRPLPDQNDPKPENVPRKRPQAGHLNKTPMNRGRFQVKNVKRTHLECQDSKFPTIFRRFF